MKTTLIIPQEVKGSYDKCNIRLFKSQDTNTVTKVSCKSCHVVTHQVINSE